MESLRKALAKPASTERAGRPARCVPCEGGTAALSMEAARKAAAGIEGWELVDGKRLQREFVFKDFAEAKYFVDLLAMIAEDQGHHPLLTLNYNKVRVTLTTHAAGGLTENDYVMARIIDKMSGSE